MVLSDDTESLPCDVCGNKVPWSYRLHGAMGKVICIDCYKKRLPRPREIKLEISVQVVHEGDHIQSSRKIIAPPQCTYAQLSCALAELEILKRMLVERLKEMKDVRITF